MLPNCKSPKTNCSFSIYYIIHITLLVRSILYCSVCFRTTFTKWLREEAASSSSSSQAPKLLTANFRRDAPDRLRAKVHTAGLADERPHVRDEELLRGVLLDVLELEVGKFLREEKPIFSVSSMV